MNAKANIDMLEATRLTREGRLAEAMAVLQGELPGANPSTAPSDAAGMKQAPTGAFLADHQYGAPILRRRGVDPAEIQLLASSF